VVPRVGDLVEPDQPLRVGGPSSRHCPDQPVARRQRRHHLARLARHGRLVGALDDRRQGAIDVGEDRRP